MDVTIIPDEMLIECCKELATAFVKAQIEETKNPNNAIAKGAVLKYRTQLDKLEKEIEIRNLKVD